LDNVKRRWIMKLVERLEKLGFTKVAKELKAKEEFKRKLIIAYEHFKYITPEAIEKFNEELKEKTYQEISPGYYKYNRLKFVKISEYDRIPPESVLNKLEEAQKLNIFDEFEVAFIEEVEEDPIIFGRIKGCEDRFFICQWDNDIKVEELEKFQDKK